MLKFTGEAVADVKAIPKHLKGPLKKELLKTVAKNPVGCSRGLTGVLKGFRSYTWQDYRIVYRVFEDIRAVGIVGLGLRSPQSSVNIYRKLEMLAQTGNLAQGVLFSIRGLYEPTP